MQTFNVKYSDMFLDDLKALKKDFSRYELFGTLRISNISLCKGWTVLISEIGKTSTGPNLEREE